MKVRTVFEGLGDETIYIPAMNNSHLLKEEK